MAWQTAGNVHAVLDDDVQLDGDLMFVVLRDVDAFAHRLAAQQVDDAVRHGAVGHALHAEAARRRRAGDARERGVAHERRCPFRFSVLSYSRILSAKLRLENRFRHCVINGIIYDTGENNKRNLRPALRARRRAFYAAAAKCPKRPILTQL